MDNLTIIKQEFESLKGQFVITESWKIERLVAIGSDEMDYYYVTYNGRKLTFNTCVGSIIQLKDKIDEKDYSNLVRIAKLNHWDQETLWGRDRSEERKLEIQAHKTELMNLRGKDSFLTEVFWEIN